MASVAGIAFAPNTGLFHTLAAVLGLSWGSSTLSAANIIMTRWHRRIAKTVTGLVACVRFRLPGRNSCAKCDEPKER
ncbi:hypothetical protein QF047_002299 [Arthrobacter sp. W4I7]|nr:hypothetical protein [Arthrobacter sp. W4I7]